MQKPWIFIEYGHEGGGFQDDCWISGLDDYAYIMVVLSEKEEQE